MVSEKSTSVRPRIIIHGGAGNITRQNLPEKSYEGYRDAMLGILAKANSELQRHDATALDVSTYAVSLLEDNSLFNAGHGAVYTTAGTHELEASVMVSSGYRKRGVGVMKVRRARNPIKLAREMLIRGEQDYGGGAGNHCQLEGETCDRLAEEWGLDLVCPSYFWTRRRWDEHRRGLGKTHDDETYERDRRQADKTQEQSVITDAEGEATISDENCLFDFTIDDQTWNGKEYLPQGTVGAVVLDRYGVVCAATSTGGLTNKLPGRIGDTPTLGAGFWAEEWPVYLSRPPDADSYRSHPSTSLVAMFADCFPRLSGYFPLSQSSVEPAETRQMQKKRAVGMSGTGNGDSFLRLSAVRTTAAIARFTSSHPYGVGVPLQDAVSNVAGPNGTLQQSAEDRWHVTGEGEGGIIGIDFEDKGKVVFDFNCGGLFRAWIDDHHKERFAIFQDEK